MRIIGPPSASLPVVLDRAANVLGASALFVVEIAPALWSAAEALTIDPVGVVAQSFMETGGGRFGGRITADFRNPCGLKVRDKEAVKRLLATTDDDHALLHQIFPNWEVGALAMVQHLRAYAGWPVAGLIVDPRYALVAGQRCESFEDLSGRWAPSPTYGAELVALARRLTA